MEQSRLPGLTRISQRMRILADASLNGAEFTKLCKEFGWILEPEAYPQEYATYMAFHLSAIDRWFHVTLTDGNVNCAVLPLMFWEDFDSEFYDSEALYRRARINFDRKYEKALQQTEKVLGAPLQTWVQKDEDHHQKAVWRGQNSILALQQDDYDTQFGFDINFLIQPHQGSLPQILKLLV